MLRKLLFRLAKTPSMGKVIGNVFRYGSWLLPVQKLYLTKDTIAFPHPRPSYDDHIILSPRKAIPNLFRISPDGKELDGIWRCIHELQQKYEAFHEQFTLVANGGPRQEVQQLHLHLFSRPALVKNWRYKGLNPPPLYCNESLRLLRSPEPQWTLHFIIEPIFSINSKEGAASRSYPFSHLLECLQWLDFNFALAKKGYSLIYQYTKTYSGDETVIFHVISGAKL